VGLLLAGLSSAVFGFSDFMGGLASRRAPAIGVVVVGQVVGVILLLGLLPLTGGEPTAADLALGAIGGLAGTIGLLLFYRALADGVMSTVAPITAIVGAVVPLTYGLATGDDLTPTAAAGVLLGIAAIGLVSTSPEVTAEPTPRRALVMAAIAGAGFGIFFVFLSRTGDDAGLWPLLGARAATLPAAVLAAVVVGARLPRGRSEQWPAAASGLDMVANALFLLATRHGALSVVSVVGSLYPVTTVVLARFVLGEQLGRVRLVGLGTAAVAIALITLGS
jgi:drug/metabolite transporter (DMT)-like permease